MEPYTRATEDSAGKVTWQHQAINKSLMLNELLRFQGEVIIFTFLLMDQKRRVLFPRILQVLSVTIEKLRNWRWSFWSSAVINWTRCYFLTEDVFIIPVQLFLTCDCIHCIWSYTAVDLLEGRSSKVLRSHSTLNSYWYGNQNQQQKKTQNCIFSNVERLRLVGDPNTKLNRSLAGTSLFLKDTAVFRIQ